MKRQIACVVLGIGLNLSGAWAGDLEDYGEYLSGECTSCHRLDGAGEGIPSIVGWEPELFIEKVKSFKTGDRENPAMVAVARSLDDEQLKALAHFFGSRKPKR